MPPGDLQLIFGSGVKTKWMKVLMPEEVVRSHLLTP